MNNGCSCFCLAFLIHCKTDAVSGGSIHFLQQQLNYSRGKSVIRKKRNFWARKEYKSVGKSVSCLPPKAEAFMVRTSRGSHGQWVKWESSEQILFLLVCLFVVNGLSSL